MVGRGDSRQNRSGAARRPQGIDLSQDDDIDTERLLRMRPPDRLLAEALERAAAAGLEASPEVARSLELLAGGPSVGRALEIGRGAGLATLCLARGAVAARVVSVAPPGRADDGARELFAAAGLEDRIELVDGEVLAAVESLEGYFDRVHLDGDLEAAIRRIDRVLPKLTVGGILTVEGLLPRREEAVDRARAVTGYLVMHPQLAAQVLPIGGGLGVARKLRPLVTEMGGPF